MYQAVTIDVLRLESRIAAFGLGACAFVQRAPGSEESL